VTTIAYFFLATGAQSILYDGVALTAASVMFVAVAASRPQPISAYMLLSFGVLLLAIGDIVYGISQPVPSPADMLYVSAYPLIGLGLAGMIKTQPSKERSPLTDALIVVVGIGLSAMALLLFPSGDPTGLGFLTRAVAVGYPLMDLVLITILVRAACSDSERRISFLLIGSALVLLLVADVGYALQDFGTGYVLGGALDVAWLFAYACFGAALLDPSIVHRDEFRRSAGRVPKASLPKQREGQSWTAVALSHGLRFRMMLMLSGRLLLGLMVVALVCAVSWRSPSLVLLAGAYGGTGILIMVAGSVRSY
jgi:hypothetical protein